MQDQLTKNILATVAYYDSFEYPLTSFEIWRHLIRTDYYQASNEPLKISLLEVINKLDNGELSTFIQQANGFYFLKGQNHLSQKRIHANKIASLKIKRLKRLISLLRFLPYIKMIGLTGRLAMKNARVQSDWDLFIVTQYGKIWTARTLITAFVHLIGKRRYADKVKDRACLNFFVTDKSLEVITKDLFSANEYMFLLPLYGWSSYERFQIKNKWIRKLKPTYSLDEIAPLKIIEDSFTSKIVKKIGEKILSPPFIENTLRSLEKKRIMKNPKTHQEGSLIYANDDALVFLPSPHGPKVFEQFKEKINKFEP